MSSPLPSPRHTEARQNLFDRFRQLTRLHDPLGRDQLEHLGISALQFNLANAETFPQYFLPATPEKLASLEHRRPALRSDLTTDEMLTEVPAYLQSATMCAVLQGHLVNHGRDSPGMLDATRWEVGRELEQIELRLHPGQQQDVNKTWAFADRYTISDHRSPHLMGFVGGSATDSELPIRHEILCAMGIILDRMGLEWSQTHLVFPVIMISFAGGKGSIIQAHFDGSVFSIQCSRWYSFIAMEKETIDLFFRWMLTDPVGDTAIVAGVDGNSNGPNNKSPPKSRAFSRLTQYCE